MSFKIAYLENLMQKVIDRNPGEPEFHQAVREVLETLEPVLNARPEYIERGVLDAIVERAKKGESYLFANRPDEINEVLRYVAEATGRKMLPTLPMWVAYVGLPFLFLGSLITGKRPLYTRASLASLRADTDFPLDKSRETFGYSPRSLEETVKDHVAFLVKEGMVTL